MTTVTDIPRANLPALYAALKWASLAVVALGVAYLAWGLYLAAEPLFAVLLFGLGAITVTLFGWARFYNWRFVFPGVAAVAIFIALPVVYTSAIGFTNYSARNLLTFHRVQEYHLQTMVRDETSARPFALTEDMKLYFPATETNAALITNQISEGPELQAAEAGPEPAILPMKEVVQRRDLLQSLVIHMPQGGELTMDGLRSFATSTPLYRLTGDGILEAADGTRLTPNQTTGFYQTETGEQVTPGWRVNIGWANFKRIVTNEGVRQPMFQIFVWTVTFAFLSMVFTFALGTALAVILEWPHLAFKPLYRVLLVLPYAVPAFISILVFRGLFNQNFGEINLILSNIFGLKPDWFSNPNLARSMLLIVNTWLGFPYWMLLITGFLKAVPNEHYKAAALEGAGPVRNFFAITLPQILPPSVPLLISNFAFNFNNIVLILLLTRGGPDIPGTIIPAGETDLLGSFTFRIAFQNSGQDFGLAGAISTLIFLITGIIAYANFRLMQRAAARRAAR